MARPSKLTCHPGLRTPPNGKSQILVLIVVLAVIFLANMAYDGPVSHPAYAQEAESSIKYAENGTSPVGAFVAYDQDGDAIKWSLSGPDADLFIISDRGVLAFKEPPNYEDPQSAAAVNLYRVTIEAGGGAHDVAVTVTDVDEAGTASIDRPQPQADSHLGASLSDEDDGVAVTTWQWARSADGTTWTDIRGPRRPGGVQGRTTWACT